MIQNKQIKIVDLFSGIGGIRLGVEQASKEFDVNVESVFSCDINPYACKVYKKQFNEDSFRNINDIDENSIPNFDLLLAGFPCQSFSRMGYEKGFEDIRGTLFFDICRILDKKKPQAFLLENVKGLVGNNKGKTFEVILKHLRELGYNVFYKVLNSKNFGVPQHRERIYIVGLLNHTEFEFPDPHIETKIKDILEPKVDKKYYFSRKYLDYLINKKIKEESKGNGFYYKMIDPEGVSTTLLYSNSCVERNIIYDPNISPEEAPAVELWRRLTPLEFERLQGFPEGWADIIADTKRCSILGNSVTVPVVKEVSKSIIKKLLEG